MITSHDQPLWEDEHFECLQAMGPNGRYMTCEPVNPHDPQLKEHYDQVWLSLIDIYERSSSISSIF